MNSKTINIKGQLLSLDEPQVMGILNVTPDSFYAGSRKRLLLIGSKRYCEKELQ